MTEVSDPQIPKRAGLASNRSELGAWLRETRTILEDLNLSIVRLVEKDGVLTEEEMQASFEFMQCVYDFNGQIINYQKECKFHYE